MPLERLLETIRRVHQGDIHPARLSLVEGTGKVHVTNILAKLRVSDRTQAILAGVKQDIIQLD
jgi:ATP/maltotriose-dependent transcriptional regulator MalT